MKHQSDSPGEKQRRKKTKVIRGKGDNGNFRALTVKLRTPYEARLDSNQHLVIRSEVTVICATEFILGNRLLTRFCSPGSSDYPQLTLDHLVQNDIFCIVGEARISLVHYWLCVYLGKKRRRCSFLSTEVTVVNATR